MLRYKVAAVSGWFLLAVVVLALLAPVTAPYDPGEFAGDVLNSPSAQHVVGTDELGRDVLSRLIWGARTSLGIGVGAVGIATVVGTIIGLASGLSGGMVDGVVQRIVETIMVFPPLLLALLLVSVTEPSVWIIMIAIVVPSVPQFARVMRGGVLSVKQQPYIEAARAIGASPTRLAFRHVLPNIMAPLLVLATVSVGRAIITEATLAFLGLSVPPPAPTWGGMLSGASRQYFTEAPWLALAPGIVLSLVVLSFNMFGDALRDTFDPKMRGR